MKQKKGNTRKTGKEQYYTKPEIADECVAEVKKHFLNHPDDIFIEPAGGNGDFIRSIRRIFPNKIISYDIEPKIPEIIQGNFLEQDLSLFGNKTLYVVSNPPFGRASSLSKKFFNHCASFSQVKAIAFIVPKAWRKWSTQNSLSLDFHLVLDKDLSTVAFYSPETGDDYDAGNLQTVFQIWERKSYKRKKYTIPDHGLIKRASLKEADIAITLFGWSCGKILREFDRNKKNTCLGYYKVKNDEVISALEKLDLSIFYKNVSYTYALSDKEIQYSLNEYFNL